MFTAQSTPATGIVNATNGTITGWATVNVVFVPIDHIVVIPDPVSIVVGGNQLFIAVAFDVNNDVIFGVDFTWSTDVGTVDASGFFTAQTTTAIGVVTAAKGTKNYSATVTVIPGPIYRIIVLPDPVNLTVGSTQAFTATAYDSYNNTIPGAIFIWTTDVGSVDATGLFTAQTSPGTGTVTATIGTISDSADVDIVIGTIDHIIVNPDPATVVVRAQQQFTAAAYDAYNNLITDAVFLWSSNVGDVNSTGFFTAWTTPGIGIVTATNWTVNGSANVEVIVGSIDHIIVTPDPVSIIVDGVFPFIAVAYDVYNNTIPNVDFNWTTDVGTINATGFFTAQSVPGSGIVNASNDSISGSANVSVIDVSIHHIEVIPNPESVVVGSTQSFTAIAYDVLNNTIPGVTFIWTTDVGSIDANGLFTAQTTPGIGTVTATNGIVNGSANVTVIVGDVDHIVVTPDPANVTVGTSQLFTATAYDAYNNVIIGVDFNWTTDVGSVDATGLFTAQTNTSVGIVTATNGTVSGSAIVYLLPGPIDTTIHCLFI
jgi:hypothetical protein